MGVISFNTSYPSSTSTDSQQAFITGRRGNLFVHQNSRLLPGIHLNDMGQFKVHTIYLTLRANDCSEDLWNIYNRRGTQRPLTYSVYSSPSPCTSHLGSVGSWARLCRASRTSRGGRLSSAPCLLRRRHHRRRPGTAGPPRPGGSSVGTGRVTGLDTAWWASTATPPHRYHPTCWIEGQE